MLHPGHLDHYVAFEARKPGVDEAGNAYSGEWETVCTRWCKWSEMYAREKASQGRNHAENRVILKTWLDEELSFVTSTDMRARVVAGRNKGKIGAIVYVQNETANEIAIAIDTGATP